MINRTKRNMSRKMKFVKKRKMEVEFQESIKYTIIGAVGNYTYETIVTNDKN